MRSSTEGVKPSNSLTVHHQTCQSVESKVIRGLGTEQKSNTRKTLLVPTTETFCCDLWPGLCLAVVTAMAPEAAAGGGGGGRVAVAAARQSGGTKNQLRPRQLSISD